MTQRIDRVSRRSVLRVGGIAGATVAGFPTIAGAKGNRKGSGGGRNPRDVDIEDSKRADSATGRNVRTARPSLDFFPGTTILPAHSFRIENVDTGDTLTVNVDSNERPDTDAANFFISAKDGSLRGDETTITCYSFHKNGSATSVVLETTIDGDSSVFHNGNPGTASYFDYQLTLLMGRSEVAKTSEHLIPIAHPTEFKSSAHNAKLTYSWNGEHLPSDTTKTVSHLLADGKSIPADVSYRNSDDHLVAAIQKSTLDNENVGVGDHTVAMTVKNPTTGWRIISFRDKVTIPQDF